MTPTRDADQRSPDQDAALEQAFVDGALPEEDRRFDLAEKIAEGFRFAKSGNEWSVTTPDGEYGHGASPEEAVRNVGAVIVPNADGRRVLTRRDGSDVALDAPLSTEG